ncbi:MAG: fibronectin type III domain-containing protein, partial [Chloroflexi bacterium]|nr:fibronectin type III domain-containing protein [Chloroflexota bacterium]
MTSAPSRLSRGLAQLALVLLLVVGQAGPLPLLPASSAGAARPGIAAARSGKQGEPSGATPVRAGTTASAPSPFLPLSVGPGSGTVTGVRAASGEPALNPGSLVANVRISDITDISVVISWETAVASRGSIVYAIAGSPGLGGGSGSRSVDVRGASFVGNTHSVRIGNLRPAASYQFLIESDGVLAGGGAPRIFQTGPTLPIPGPAHFLVGRLLDGAGQAAGGCPLFVRLSDRNGRGSPGDSTWLSTLTNANGEWHVELHARTSDLRRHFDYQTGGDALVVESQCSSSGSLRQTYSTSVVDPSAGFGDLGDLRLRTTASATPAVASTLPVWMRITPTVPSAG